MYDLNAPSHLAPSAPSTALWSQLNVADITFVSLYIPSFVFTISFLVPPTAKMPACGGLTIAAKCLMPNAPLAA